MTLLHVYEHHQLLQITVKHRSLNIRRMILVDRGPEQGKLNFYSILNLPDTSVQLRVGSQSSQTPKETLTRPLRGLPRAPNTDYRVRDRPLRKERRNLL